MSLRVPPFSKTVGGLGGGSGKYSNTFDGWHRAREQPDPSRGGVYLREATVP